MNEFERDLRREKVERISRMKETMKREKEKFKAFSNDDGHLENQIMNIYNRMENN